MPFPQESDECYKNVMQKLEAKTESLWNDRRDGCHIKGNLYELQAFDDVDDMNECSSRF